MKRTLFNKNTMCVFFVALLLSTSTLAQFTCDISERNWFYRVEVEEGIPNDKEFSGLAYHPERDILFIPICAPIPDLMGVANISMKGYNVNPEAYNDFDVVGNNDFDVRFLDKNGLLKGTDFEGMTHLKDDYFALLEEGESKIYFLKYKPNDKQFEVLRAQLIGIEPIKKELIDGSIISFGFGGITYDPNTSRLYVIQEYERKLYSASLVWPGELLADSSANLGDDNIPPTPYHLATGLFHFGQIYPENHPLANNILVTSFIDPPARTQTMIEFKISLDQNNDLSLLKLIKEINFEDIKRVNDKDIKPINAGVEYKPEGIVVTENTIYVVSEWTGLSSYSKKSISDMCTDGYYIYDEANKECKCVTCPSELWINTNAYNVNEEEDDMSLSGLYESVESIETVVTNSSIVDVIIRNNEAVNLKSDHIILNEGFKVEAGACLNATIDPCE